MDARSFFRTLSYNFSVDATLIRSFGVAFIFFSTMAWSSQGWTPAADMEAARVFATATVLNNGKVFVAGGQNLDGVLDTSEIYDPTTDSWQSGPAIPGGRTGHTATRLPDGRVLLVSGGPIAFPPPPNMFGLLYDPADGNLHQTVGWMDRRVSHTATLLDSGKVLIAGGWSGAALRGALLFDVETGEFSDASTMITPRTGHSAVKLGDGRVLVVGGGNGAGGGTSTATAETYDPLSNSWTQVPSLEFARSSHTAVLLLNGKAMVIGGSADNVRVLPTEIFDPETNAWSFGGALVSGRAGLSATLLPDGSVLAAGGSGPTGPTATSSIYFPDLKQWEDAGTMQAEHSGHEAVMLDDERVLVIGGAAFEYLRSADLYVWDTIFSHGFE